MFKFIKNLFKKEKEPEVVVVDVDESGVPELEESYARFKETHDRICEESIVRAQRIVEMQNEIDRTLKNLGIVYKFRDVNTGEIYVICPGDRESFSKMMSNKDMQMIFD